MKILLQREAHTISDRELKNNQQYLIDLFKKIFDIPSTVSSNLRRFFLINHQNSCK